MPTKKGSSKASKAKKASNKQRKSPKRGVTGRAGATRRVSTGRVTAAGKGAGTSIMTAAPRKTAGANPVMVRSPVSLPDQKASGETPGAPSGRMQIL